MEHPVVVYILQMKFTCKMMMKRSPMSVYASCLESICLDVIQYPPLPSSSFLCKSADLLCRVPELCAAPKQARRRPSLFFLDMLMMMMMLWLWHASRPPHRLQTTTTTTVFINCKLIDRHTGRHSDPDDEVVYHIHCTHPG